MNQKEKQSTPEITKEVRSIYCEELKPDEKDLVRESAHAYGPIKKKQGEYTIEDYRNWPEDERIELIDGEIIVMEAPSTYHQISIVKLSTQFDNYISGKNGPCMVMVSPIDVQLDQDEKTMLQPDMIIICDPDKINHWGIFGAPDFILEVVSRSSRRYDMLRKKNKYIAAGVREYWILDMERKLLIVYAQGKQESPVIYPLEGKVGVAIYDDDLQIDLDQMVAVLERLQA